MFNDRGGVVSEGDLEHVRSAKRDLSQQLVLGRAHRAMRPVGSPSYQPGLLDGGKTATDQIARLTRFIPIQTSAPMSVDCAIAEVLNPADVSNAILRIGPPQGTQPAAIDMVVHKFGRTSSYSVGRVSSIDTDVTVGYEMGQVTFQGQMIIQSLTGTAAPFSKAGDSGSLIVDR